MDPDPVLPLLWRDPAALPVVRRGPRPKVSLDDMIDTGIAIADTDGLNALSMRGLAQRLGIGAMTLYTYVPGRDELLVLMIDQALGRSSRPDLGAEVRGRLEAVAESSFSEYVSHPWLLEDEGLRAWLGPHAAARYEWQLTAVDALGLSSIAMDQAVTLLDGIAATAVRGRHALVVAERRSGQTELEWWQANAEPLQKAMGDREFPLAARVGQAAGETYQAATDPDRQFRFALDRVVDGLLALSEQGPM